VFKPFRLFSPATVFAFLPFFFAEVFFRESNENQAPSSSHFFFPKIFSLSPR